MSFIFLRYVQLGRCCAIGCHLHLLVVLFALLRDFKTFTKDGHKIEAIALQVDPLPLEIVIDELLLLANHLAAAAYLLQQDLHHVHLADGQTLHLGHGLFHLELVLGSLEVPQLAQDGARRVGCLPAGEDFAHLSRVKLQHRVLVECKAFVDLAVGDVGAGAAEDALGLGVVGAMHSGVERSVALVVRHRAEGRGILHH